MTKHIGIYNRYWNSLGGGEKYTGTIAEILSKFVDVDVCLIGAEPFSKHALEKRLTLDLSRCRTTVWPDVYDQQTQMTAGYDLFINSTYCSSLRSLARRSAYICFFPHQLATDYPSKAASFERHLRRWPAIARFGPRVPCDGFTPLAGARGVDEQSWCWFGPNAVFRVPHASGQSGTIRLPVRLAASFSMARIVVERETCSWRLTGGHIEIDVPFGLRVASPASFTVLIELFRTVESACESDGPQAAMAIHVSGSVERDDQTAASTGWLESYDRFVAISHYTASWIERRWHQASSILTPSVDTSFFTPGDNAAQREPIIVSVGRFFAGGHNKKHDVMIDAFKRMVDQRDLPDGWRLVLAGSRHTEHAAHLEYYASLQSRAAGYPIMFCPDIPRNELLALYRRASIYWHAAGFGESETNHPELFEHFGITTCEAMACGLIPVVIARAGQREIVTDGVTGYTFTTTEEFVTKTLRAISTIHTPAGDLLRKAARQSLDRYSTAAFRRSTERIFRPLL